MASAGVAYVDIFANWGPFEASTARMPASIGKRMESLGKTLTKSISLPLAGLGVAATKFSVDFSRSMELIHTQAGASQKEVQKLEKQVLNLAKVTPQGPNQLAAALFRLEGAGMRGQKAMKALKASADLAAVGNANVEDTAKTLSQVWFTNIKGASNFRDVVAEVNATVGAGDLRLQQLVDALGTGVLASAKQAGISFQDVTGALAVFGDETNNVAGWSAQLATAFHFFTNPTEKATGALESIGLTSKSLAEDMHKPKGLVSALSDLKEHLDKLPGGERGVPATQVLGDILPGGRGRVLLVLLNQLDRLKQKMVQIKGTNKNFGDSVKKTMEQPAVKLQKAWSQVQVALIQIGNAITPLVVPALEHAASFIEKIGEKFEGLSPATQEWIVKIGLAAIALGPVLTIGGKLVGVYKKLAELTEVIAASDAVQALVGGLGDLKAAISLALGGEFGGFTMLGKEWGGALLGGLTKALPRLAAAAGLGNIIISATQGDWTSAGFKAGGALVGGIAGAFLGPEGAMIGAGIGSFIGGFLAPAHHQAETLAEAFGRLRGASADLRKSEGQLRSAKEREKNATHSQTQAERHLADLRASHGGSGAIHKAELNVLTARQRTRRATDAVRRAEEHLQEFRTLKGESAGAVFHRTSLYISEEQKHLNHLKQLIQVEGKTPELTKKREEALKRLIGWEQQRNVALSAARKFNKGWAESLEGLNAVQNRFGRNGIVLVRRLQEQSEKLGDLKAKVQGVPKNALPPSWLIELRQTESKFDHARTAIEHFSRQTGNSLGGANTAVKNFSGESSKSFESLAESAGRAIGNIMENTGQAAKALGAGTVRFSLKQLSDASAYHHQREKSTGLQRGGFTVPGTGTGDSFHTVLPEGSFVLNRRAARVFGFQRGGSVPVVLEPGEPVFMPHEVAAIGAHHLAAMNSAVPRFQKGGGIGPEPRLAGPGGGLKALGQAAIRQIYKGAESYLGKHKPKVGRGSSHSYSAHTLSGKVSWFNGGATAGGSTTSRPGVAVNLRPGTEGGWDNKITRGFMADSLAGHPDYIRLTIQGHTAVLPITDLGPAGFTHRAIDVTEGGVRKLGCSTANFPTDAVGVAKFLQRGGNVNGDSSYAKYFPRARRTALKAWHALGRSGAPDPTIFFNPIKRPYTDVGTSHIHIPSEYAGDLYTGSGSAQDYIRRALVHEFAHTMQKRVVLDSVPEREGGATWFSNIEAPGVWRKLGLPYAKPTDYGVYAAYLNKVQHEHSRKWALQGQFKKFQLGGLVGLAAGGSPSAGKPLSAASLPLFLRSGGTGPADATHVIKWAQAHLGQTRDYGYPGEWCGAFLGADMQAHGIQPPSGYPLAANWAGWGKGDSSPLYGDVVVIGGSGHVGLALGGNKMISGNFSNKVAESSIGEAAGGRPILGYRTPPYTHSDSKNPHETKAQEVAHTYKEKIPAEYHGAKTGSLNLPSVPKNRHGLEAAIDRWRKEVRVYRKAKKLAEEKNRPGVVQAIAHNITAIETFLRQLHDALHKARLEAARKKFTSRIHGKLGKVAGYEQVLEGLERDFNIASERAEQVVALEPQMPELPASASDGKRSEEEKAFVDRLTGYVKNDETSAYGDVLNRLAAWRNAVLKAEIFGFGKGKPSVRAMESHSEKKVYEVVTEIDAISQYSERVAADIAAFRASHGSNTPLPKWIKDEIRVRDNKRAKLPFLRSEDSGLRGLVGELREKFYPGNPENNRINPPAPPLEGTGTLEEMLVGIQGIHWPDLHELLPASALLPPRVVGRFGGSIWDVETSMEELGLKITQAASSLENGSGGQGEGENEALLRELLTQANQEKIARAIEERVIGQGFRLGGEVLPPYAGKAHTGAVVPGPRTQERTMVLRGGEGILTEDQRDWLMGGLAGVGAPAVGSQPNVHVTIYESGDPVVKIDDKEVEAIIDRKQRREARRAGTRRAGVRGV